ncbi:hypothetical protein A3Q56_06066 [Intoshia linei]|uniref:cyclin-dependent kinase n=1 Tax=Intoshia linei TaxID=1819745 RepID=A0A177AVV3_9BILA|nr:hypothetical protein A3Q56_06066 [Intoshia linei]
MDEPITCIADEDFNSINHYKKVEKIGEGTYGIVYKSKCLLTGNMVALKKVRLDGNDEGVPATTIRETATLRELKHRNVVSMLDVILKRNGLYLVFEYMDMDLRKYLDLLPKQIIILPSLLKSYMYQMMDGILYCHLRRIIHRDLKPQNLLIKENGILKIADFGLARTINIPVRRYTHEVVTLWYRAPEILLGCSRYSLAVDIWSIGCIFAEISTRRSLFRGDSEIDQLFRMFRALKKPTDEEWPEMRRSKNYTHLFPGYAGIPFASRVPDMEPEAIDLLLKTLIFDPSKRITAKEALNHIYFENFDTINLPIVDFSILVYDD